MTKMPSQHEMRAAVAARDGSFDGRFCCGVVTTGVFCRPSCAKRPALPDNLRFFPDAATALAAGYRPCRRCHPTGDSPGLSRLVGLARFIESHADERLPLATLAARVGLSPSRLQRVFNPPVNGLSRGADPSRLMRTTLPIWLIGLCA